jgi:general transcription factor 3C polypeptide 5 (transcription factor C subunit 1)
MKYKLDKVPGADITRDVGPSAEFIQMPVSYNYKFQQNSFIKYTDDDGGEVNLQRSFVNGGYSILKLIDKDVPQGPKESLPPESVLSPYLQSLIANIRAELERRPIITRHLLYNRLGWDKRDKLRQAAIYCGYFFESGPWREALIKWNVDPRTDPSYRMYQTVSFLSYRKSGNRHFKPSDKHVQKLTHVDPSELVDQHKFDGKHVSNTGNLFQFCDITDPLIRCILDTDDIRTTCAPTAQGWYHSGTWAKATVILKDKMNCILTGQGVDETLYERVLTWPELWADDEIYSPYKREYYDRKVHKEKTKEHAIMSSVRWAARNPRYAFEKMEASLAQGHGREEGESGDGDGDLDNDADIETQVPEDMTEELDTAVTIANEDYDEDAEGSTDEDYAEDDVEEGMEADAEEDADGILEPLENDSEIVKSTGREGPFGGLFKG